MVRRPGGRLRGGRRWGAGAAAHPLRPAAPAGSTCRMGGAGSRAAPAGGGPGLLRPRHLRRAEDPRRGLRAPRAGGRQPFAAAGRRRPRGAQRSAGLRRRHRSGAGLGALAGAGGQPPGALRRRLLAGRAARVGGTAARRDGVRPALLRGRLPAPSRRGDGSSRGRGGDAGAAHPGTGQRRLLRAPGAGPAAPHAPGHGRPADRQPPRLLVDGGGHAAPCLRHLPPFLPRVPRPGRQLRRP